MRHSQKSLVLTLKDIDLVLIKLILLLRAYNLYKSFYNYSNYNFISLYFVITGIYLIVCKKICRVKTTIEQIINSL
jgi:hypothetical protein